MQSVQFLKESGFQVFTSNDAIGCTEVSSDQPFYFYNPRFLSMICEIDGQVKRSQSHNGKERIIVAGLFDGQDDFPFIIISINEYESLMDMLQDWCVAEEKRKTAEEEQQKAQNQLEAFLGSFTHCF